MTTATLSTANMAAEKIPYVTADEAYTLLKTAFERFITLLETLDPADWSKPTACTAWNVRDMVAHQAGGYASGTSYREMARQYSAKPQSGQLPEDAVNALQLAERADKSPAELIAELKQVGPLAIQKWAHAFRLAKLVTIPHPVPGALSLRHLLWVIHSRDTWMHRLDICRAIGRPFEQTREHDGRINELVVRDAAAQLSKKLGQRALTLSLTGMAGGTWQIGQGESVAELEMDALDFNIFASGRFSYEEGMKRARISGDQRLVSEVFKDFIVLY
jgi:uncharacterized protein (TIGR03083 family)